MEAEVVRLLEDCNRAQAGDFQVAIRVPSGSTTYRKNSESRVGPVFAIHHKPRN